MEMVTTHSKNPVLSQIIPQGLEMPNCSFKKGVVQFCIVACCGFVASAQAADVLVNTAPGSGFAVTSPASPTPLLRVDSGGLVIGGTYTPDPVAPPVSGAGTRMVFDPGNGSLRFGTAVSDEWDAANTKKYTFAGGKQVKASGYGSFAFGDAAIASGVVSIALGSGVTASGTAGFTAGASNICSGFACTAIGYTNTASGQGSVAIGYRASADADYSVALGHRVSSGGFTGSFIFGDESTTAIASNTASNQFMVRAAGGVRLRTNNTLSTGCDLPAGSGVFSCTSDRSQKEDFRPLDTEAILRKVVALPITNWRYIAEQGNVRHIGPVAQDFHAAFELGTDNKTIGMADISGVSLAAIQALAARTEALHAKSAEVEVLRGEVATLRQALLTIERRLQGN